MCPRCQKQHPEDAFRRNPRTGRFSPYCISCTKEYKRQQYAAKPELRQKALDAAAQRKAKKGAEVKAYQNAYRAAHRKELRLRAVAYRLEEGEALRQKNRDRTKTDLYRESANAHRRQRLETDPEFRARVLLYGRKANRKHYRQHRISLLEQAKAAYWADPDTARAKVRKSLAVWRAAHPDVLRAVQARRNAIRRGAVAAGFDDAAHYRLLEQWQQGRCYHCGAPYGAYHREHLVAINNGGRHEAGNLALACSRCDGSKLAKVLWREWIPPTNGIPPLLLLEPGISLISTFGTSERWLGPAAQNILQGLKGENPTPLIYDWEWLRRREAVLNLLSSRDGSARRIFARKTQVVEVDSDSAWDFLEHNHLQGFGRGTVYTGLAYEGDLVAMCSWLEIGGAVELNRLAFKGIVVGGFSKLVSSFKKTFLPAKMPIISFLDPRYGDGHGYEKIGFKAAGETALPAYYYVGPGGLFHRRLFMKQALKKRFVLFDDKATEREIARWNGYYRVYGLPQRRYVFQ